MDRMYNQMIFKSSFLRRKCGKMNKFQKSIAFLFMVMYNYTAK